MNYQNFVNEITNRVSEHMGEEYLVSVNDVRKNNGICLQGLSIHGTEQKIVPTIYLNGYYREFRNGKEISTIVEDILFVHEHAGIDEEVDMSFFRDYEQVKGRIAYKLVNYEKNRELLQDIPHIAYLDLAIVFYYILSEETLVSATILLYQTHLNMWNKTVQSIYRDAKKNTPQLLKSQIRSMTEVILELLERQMENSTDEKDEERCREELAEFLCEEATNKRMFILSNESQMFGASCILYPNVLHNFAGSIGDDLYILPSSVHEVILIPASECADGNELSKMVCDVNQTQVEPEEILSNHVYFYTRKDDRIIGGF